MIGFIERTYSTGGITASLTVSASLNGSTVVEMPPIGRIIADTHSSPMDIELSVKEIDLVAVSSVIGGDSSSAEQFLEALSDDSRSAAIELALILILASAIMGLIIGHIVGGRSHPGIWALGTVAGIVVSGSIMAATILTYQVSAFQQPTYSGNLRIAPVLVGAVQQRWEDVGDLQDEVQRIANNVTRFFNAVEEIEPLERSTHLRVLHISDIHNNPLAYDLVEKISAGFGADLIIDTGDITDYGTALEADLVGRLERLEIPYHYVPGNHDSPAVLSALADIDGVSILSEPVTIDGIKFTGLADPASDTPLIAKEDPADKAELSEMIRETLEDSTADVLAIHDPDIAKEAAGLVKTVLTGHSHTEKITEMEGTWILDAGTTGGAGIRSFEVEEGVPLTLQLIYIDRESKKLVAVDSLSVQGIDQEFTLQRRNVD